jgi:hypothetical protein
MPAVAELIAPAEVLQALQDGRRQGQWIRSYCPYCSPGRVRHGDRPLAANLVTGFGPNRDKPGWLCHRCHAEENFRGSKAKEGLPRRQYTYDPNKHQNSDEDRRAAALRIVERCTHIEDGDPVDIYLRETRKLAPITATWPSSLRRARLHHPDDRSGRKHPCMVAVATDTSGNIYAVHRTYLTEDGRKANFGNVKLSLGPLSGRAVHLGIDSPKLVIGEGIESTLAAMMKYGRVGWATLFAKNLQAVEIPRSVTDIIIAADRDFKPGRREHDIGGRCARELMKRIQQEQFKFKQTREINVRIAFPPDGRADFADFG